MRASAIQSRMLARVATGLPNVSRSSRAPAHQLERALGRADRAHAVVDAPRARAAPGRSGSPAPSPAIRFVGRHAHVLEASARRGPPGPGSRTPAGRARPSRRACRAARAPSTAAGAAGPSGSVLPITIRIRQCGCSAPEIHHLRPLSTYSSPSRSIAQRDVGRVRGGDVGLGHRERRADLAVEQRAQPALLLLGRAEQRAAPPCCRCPAPSSCTPPSAMRLRAEDLRQRRVLEVRQPRPRSCGVGVEHVPQPAAARLLLELLHDRRLRVRVARFAQLLARRPARPGRRARP